MVTYMDLQRILLDDFDKVRGAVLGRVRERGKVSIREDLGYQIGTTGNPRLVTVGLEEPLKDLSKFAFVQSAHLDMKAACSINRNGADMRQGTTLGNYGDLYNSF